MRISIQDMMARTEVRFGTSGVRGLVARMDDTVCQAYTLAFLAAQDSGNGPTADAPAGNAPPATPVIIGHDLRPSSPRIAEACARAVLDAGRLPVNVGVLPTPAVAWHALQQRAPAIVVTGSHIPFDRNGIKFYSPHGEITKDDELAIQSAVVTLPDGGSHAGVTGISEAAAGENANALTLRNSNEENGGKAAALGAVDESARTGYMRRYLDFFGAGALTGRRIAVYEHSSAARDLLRELLEALGAQVLSLGRTDTFVPIDTEAVRPEDIAQARAWAAEHRFDALLSTDGDADRPLIGDEQGQWLRGDIVGILCARHLGANTVVTPVSSNTALERSGWFTNVTRTRIGSPYVLAGMAHAAATPGAIVAGYEANGGFLLGSDVRRQGRTLGALPTRDAMLPMLALLSMAAERQIPLSQLAAELPPRYTASDRLQNYTTEHSRELLTRLEKDSAQATALLAPAAGGITAIDTTDGLRVSFANGDIVHLRPSGNAPELRCYAESDTPEAATALCQACLGRL